MVYTEHVPVLANEVVHCLVKRPSGIYIDGTAGSGGHSRKILEAMSPDGLLIMLDIDEEAISYLKNKFTDPRVRIFNASYVDIPHLVGELEICGKIDGILLDLGISTHQVYEPTRGFSFMRNGPLDMRFSREMHTISAYDVVNTYDKEQLIEIFRKYGEEPYAEEIASAIVERRKFHPIQTTEELANLVSEIVNETRKHPATRVFQAIRIYVNDEFKNIREGIKGAISVLRKGGRLGVITYHSLEDKLVKRVFAEYKHKSVARVIKKHGVRPTWEEKQRNRKSRSAILRVIEKR